MIENHERNEIYEKNGAVEFQSSRRKSLRGCVRKPLSFVYFASFVVLFFSLCVRLLPLDTIHSLELLSFSVFSVFLLE